MQKLQDVIQKKLDILKGDIDREGGFLHSQRISNINTPDNEFARASKKGSIHNSIMGLDELNTGPPKKPKITFLAKSRFNPANSSYHSQNTGGGGGGGISSINFTLLN